MAIVAKIHVGIRGAGSGGKIPESAEAQLGHGRHTSPTDQCMVLVSVGALILASLACVTAQFKKKMNKNAFWLQSGTEREIPGKAPAGTGLGLGRC